MQFIIKNVQCPALENFHQVGFSERQRIASWIKKFNEPNNKDPQWKKSRNLYARLLKTMLEKGVVDEPFKENPPSEPLSPLPTYMTIFLEGSNYDSTSEKRSSIDDSSRRPSGKRKLTYTPKKTASLPDLSVMSSEEESDEDLNSLLRGPTHMPPVFISFSLKIIEQLILISIWLKAQCIIRNLLLINKFFEDRSFNI